MRSENPRALVALLQVLTALFVFRVVGQLIEYVVDVDLLPDFERWQSGALPYAALLALQVAIVTGQIVVLRAAAIGRSLLAPRWRRLMFAAAMGYFTAMVARLIAGSTFAAGDGWLDAKLPTVFHLVLATFLFVWVRLEAGDRSARDGDAPDDRVEHSDQIIGRDLEAALVTGDEDGVVGSAALVDGGR